MACAPAASFAQQNLSFESPAAGTNAAAPAAWTLHGEGYDFGVDADAVDGERSLRVTRIGGGGLARATQRLSLPLPSVDGDRIRIGAWVKTEGVDDGSAGLWVRIESTAGLLYVDGMQDGGASGTTGWAWREIEAPVFAAASRLEFGTTLRGGGTAWFDGVTIEGVDTSARPPPAARAARYLDQALDIIEEHSIRRAAIGWPRFRAAVLVQARGATTIADTYLAIRYALGSLGDHHSYLLTPERALQLSEAPVANARTGRAAVPPRGLILDGDVAYLAVPGFAGGPFAKQVELAELLQHTIARLDSAARCGWIVDLRDNSGGNVWPMLAGLGPLLGNGEAAAAVYPDGRRVPLWYRDGRAGLGEYAQLRVTGEPYRLHVPAPRVAVLHGRSTASSGEVIAAAFRGSVAYRSFGAATRGLATGNRTFPLADGASLVLTVAATSDRTGAVHVGPLAPDEATAADDEDAPLLEQQSVAAAMRWLRGECAATHAAGERQATR